jgi:hypothetical protein
MNEDRSGLIMAIIIILVIVIGFSGIVVKHRDVLVKQDTEYLYYKEYEWFNLDSAIYKYHKPIEYEGIVIDKHTGSHFVGIVGKGGHRVTDHYITFKFGNNIKEENDIYLYDKFGLNEHMTVIEKFYPYYEISYSKLK